MMPGVEVTATSFQPSAADFFRLPAELLLILMLGPWIFEASIFEPRGDRPGTDRRHRPGDSEYGQVRMSHHWFPGSHSAGSRCRWLPAGQWLCEPAICLEEDRRLRKLLKRGNRGGGECFSGTRKRPRAGAAEETIKGVTLTDSGSRDDPKHRQGA